jgi:hypothetical protein
MRIGELKSHKRSTTAALIGTMTVALLSMGGAPAMSSPVATSAGTLNVTDTTHLHLLNESGSILIEEGNAAGALPGRVKARYKLGATVTATAVIYPSGGGSISIHGVGVLHSSGIYASYAGSLTVTGGTGKYARVHGSGGFYGVVNRRSWATTMQTTGKVSY